MRRVFYAVAVAAAATFTFVPLVLLRLESAGKLVQSLKNMAAALGVPGAAVGLILTGGRIHDIDSGISDAANFVFYFAATWLLLKTISVVKTRRLTQRRHAVDR